MLDAIAVKTIDKNNGALKGYIEKNGKKTTVLYIDAPCFTKDIKQCRNSVSYTHLGFLVIL